MLCSTVTDHKPCLRVSNTDSVLPFVLPERHLSSRFILSFKIKGGKVVWRFLGCATATPTDRMPLTWSKPPKAQSLFACNQVPLYFAYHECYRGINQELSVLWEHSSFWYQKTKSRVSGALLPTKEHKSLFSRHLKRPWTSCFLFISKSA